MKDQQTTALTTKRQADLLHDRAKNLDRWCAGGVKVDALLRYTLAEMEQDENLQKCDPMSIYLALLSCAVSGLEPGKLKSEAFLIPRWNRNRNLMEAKFQIGWRGVKRQALRAGINIVADVARAKDHFVIDMGTAARIEHTPARGERGEVIGAYAYAFIPGVALPEIEWMDLDDLKKVRSKAGEKSEAWRDWESQMQRKSVLHRLGKRLPMGVDYLRGSLIEQAYERGNSPVAALDMFTDGDASRQLGDAASVVFEEPPPPKMIPEVSSAPAPSAAAPAKRGPGRPPRSVAQERPEQSFDSSNSPRPTQPASGPSPVASAPSASAPSSSSPAQAKPGRPSVVAESAPTSAPATEPAADSDSDPQQESSFEGDAFDSYDDPVDRKPASPEDIRKNILVRFAAWGRGHAMNNPPRTKELDTEMLGMFSQWAASCETDEMLEDKSPDAGFAMFREYINRTTEPFDRASGKPAPWVRQEMSRIYAKRREELAKQ